MFSVKPMRPRATLGTYLIISVIFQAVKKLVRGVFKRNQNPSTADPRPNTTAPDIEGIQIGKRASDDYLRAI